MERGHYKVRADGHWQEEERNKASTHSEIARLREIGVER